MQLFASFAVSVAAGVLFHYLCKWLDRLGSTGRKAGKKGK